MLEKERVPPCGAGERRCYFLNDQKVTKESLGVAFDERLRAAGAHRRLTPKPPFYEGTPSWKMGNLIRRAKSG